MTDPKRAYVSVANALIRNNVANATSAQETQYRNLILSAGELIENATKRRFDRRVNTIRLRGFDMESGGDVYDSYKISTLKHDLALVQSVVNGDGSTIDSADYSIIQNARTGVIEAISLDSESAFWTIGGNGRRADNVLVTGEFGYMSRWVAQTALTFGINETATLIQLDSYSGVEKGSLLKIDDEIIYSSQDVPDSPLSLTVERAVNGSTGATHDTGATIYLLEPSYNVQNIVIRLLQWYLGLDKNPLFSLQTIGDMQFPVDISSVPRDVQASIENLKPKFNGTGIDVL